MVVGRWISGEYTLYLSCFPKWNYNGCVGREYLTEDQEMATRYSASKGDSSEELHLMNEEEKITSGTSRLNKKSLVIFFGVTVVAAAIVVSTVMMTLYSGKEWLFLVLIVKIIDCFEHVNTTVCVYIEEGQLCL